MGRWNAHRGFSTGDLMVLVIRRLRKDERGVASTVGTIMALLVFLTFLSLIVNQYVPVWMKEAESAHMSSAFGQIAALKGNVDLQILSATTAENPGPPFTPVTTFAPVTLGVDGIPIFTSPTIGDLGLRSDSSPWTTQFVYSIRGVPQAVNQSSSGRITLDVFNRYFLHQTLIYENGAVVRFQGDRQSIRAEPTLVINIVDESIELPWTQNSLFRLGSVSGTTTEGIHAGLVGVDRQDYTGLTSDVWINSTTPYGVAWVGFFNRTVADAFGVPRGRFNNPLYPGDNYPLPANDAVDIATPFYRVRTTWNPQQFTYFLIVQIFNDPNGVDPFVGKVAVFRVQVGFVDIPIAEKGALT